MTYKTPGVYIKEVTVFPPSVAEVETAIPAFIGYTENIVFEGESLLNVPTKVSSLLEFETIFGFDAPTSSITVTLTAANSPQKVNIVPRYHTYKSMQMFYANGGGECYIVSVGQYANGNVTYNEFKTGLDALEKYDEPTIIAFPDAVLLNTPAQLYTLQADALMQCKKLQDRVSVFDLFESRSGVNFNWKDGVKEFRDNIGVNNLKYGAAYLPYLKTIFPYNFSYFDVTLRDINGIQVFLKDISQNNIVLKNLTETNAEVQVIQALINSAVASYDAIGETDNEAEIAARIGAINNTLKEIILIAPATNLFPNLMNNNTKTLFEILINVKIKGRLQALLQAEKDFFDDPATDIDNNGDFTGAEPSGLSNPVVTSADYAAVDYGNGIIDFELASINKATNPSQTIYGSAPADLSEVVLNGRNALSRLLQLIIQDLEIFHKQVAQAVDNFEQDLINTNAIYANIVDAIQAEGSIVPPSGAIAGVYSFVDELRGVHKAPANVSLNALVGPTEIINHDDQEDLNVDVNAGKSINAIRSFTGKGALVWGARTLAGNDNEWRYVPVRRFFNTVEESIKKSTGWAVFEPNDAGTWSLVRSMINNYLYDKWQEGALQGATPDEAYFVHIGEGITFTPAEKLQGIMRVKIGMAVVRPAEFIILEFSHKMSGT